MCGIAGLVGLRGAAVHAAVADRMLGAIGHRGPDGTGRFASDSVAIAHGRLSILDPTEAGAQPMRRGDLVLVHNGEIYNYRELAEELSGLGFTFSTGTDTEVMLAAYRAWGIDAATRFNGMWAFALWDEGRRSLWLSRDRMGVKPLYYRQAGTALAFGSELRAVVAAGPIDPGDTWRAEPDTAAVRDFLVRGLVDHSDHTFIEGIRALPAGHNLTIDATGIRLAAFWSPSALSDDATPPSAATEREDERLAEEFLALFDDSVRLRLRSDVPIGSCLSGGLDSSSIVQATARVLADAAALKSGNEKVPRIAFHARYPQDGVDESAFAQIAAANAGMEIVFSSVPMEPFLPRLEELVASQGEPFNGTSIFAQWTVMRSAHGRGLKVLLDGQGADELLGGYLPYIGYRAAGLMRPRSIPLALRELHGSVRSGVLTSQSAMRVAIRASVPSQATEAIRAASRGAFGVRVMPELGREDTLAEFHRLPGTPLARRLWQDTRSESLPALLRYEDRNSMAFGIEARVPFLDYRLVELALRLPDRLKISGGTTKRILRLAMKPHLPPMIIERRDKLGFATPQGRWIRSAIGEISSLLTQARVVDLGWVERAEVDRLLRSGRTGDASLLWRVVVLESWLRHQSTGAGVRDVAA